MMFEVIGIIVSLIIVSTVIAVTRGDGENLGIKIAVVVVLGLVIYFLTR